MLCECQEDAIRLGTMIEEALSDNVTVIILEEYCELLYQWHGSSEVSSLIRSLDDIMVNITECIKRDLCKVRREVVFLPFKASLWDSFDSVWRKEVSDENCVRQQSASVSS